MKLIEPNLATHQAARDILLTPNGLDEGHLLKVLGSIFTHRVDYADLYFQFTRSESWSLEESIVKTGSFSIDQGVGVRAVSGEELKIINLESVLEVVEVNNKNDDFSCIKLKISNNNSWFLIWSTSSII